MSTKIVLIALGAVIRRAAVQILALTGAYLLGIIPAQLIAEIKAEPNLVLLAPLLIYLIEFVQKAIREAKK